MKRQAASGDSILSSSSMPMRTCCFSAIFFYEVPQLTDHIGKAHLLLSEIAAILDLGLDSDRRL
jgi:hypothetical protein